EEQRDRREGRRDVALRRAGSRHAGRFEANPRGRKVGSGGGPEWQKQSCESFGAIRRVEKLRIIKCRSFPAWWCSMPCIPCKHTRRPTWPCGGTARQANAGRAPQK